MSRFGGAQVVVVCEDKLQEAFALRFFRMRHNIRPPRLRLLRSPRAGGGGHAWVRSRLVDVVDSMRKRHVSTVIVAMIDGDGETPQERRRGVASMFRRQEPAREPIRDDEPVAILVPCRAIESWLTWLERGTVDETSVVAHDWHRREGEISPMLKRLADACRRSALDDLAPPSLLDACTEYDARIRPHL